jgi:autotransporter-associated beta strand protein
VDKGNTLIISGVLTTSGAAIDALRKRGLGTLTLSGANAISLTSSISIQQDVLREHAAGRRQRKQ